MRGDTKEQINRCLNCPFGRCMNCVGTDREIHEFNGEIYTIAQMAAMAGKPQKTIRRRIRIGGVGYALSNYNSLREYERSLVCRKNLKRN